MKYLHNDKERFREAINITNYQTGILPQAVEKDYYVSMILKLLSEQLTYIVFKGGTSLSKCHKVIKRFSEDIDLSVDTPISQGQRREVKYKIFEVVEELGLHIINFENTRSRRNYNCYILEYDTVLPVKNILLQPTILIETSYTTVSFPTGIHMVDSYIGQMIEKEAPQLFQKYQLEPFKMKVQDIRRTLVDKVFALCDYYLSDCTQKHSRHLYDIYKLLPLVSMDESFKLLVSQVKMERKKSNICPSAQKNILIPELLEKIIQEEVYRRDYNEVTQKLLNEEIGYETAILALKKIGESGVF